MLEVGTILWAGNRPSDHNDHLHTEPPTRKTGTPPLRNPGMSAGIRVIYDALTVQFGHGEYFLDTNGRYVGNDPDVHWTHMGGWNRRRIAGSSTWSQHAWWNALDIGPYVGRADQQRFYDFLTGVLTPSPIGDLMLPITPSSAREDIRSLQGRLNTAYNAGLTEDGQYGASTAAAVRTHLGGMTGDTSAQQGAYVVARQWNGLLEQFVRVSSSGGGMNDAKVREISLAAGREVFWELGRPIIGRKA